MKRFNDGFDFLRNKAAPLLPNLPTDNFDKAMAIVDGFVLVYAAYLVDDADLIHSAIDGIIEGVTS